VTRDDYFAFGWQIAPYVGAAAALGTYIYAIAAHGLLLGGGLGWIPAIIIGVLVGALTVPLWGLAIVLPVGAAVIWWATYQPWG